MRMRTPRRLMDLSALALLAGLAVGCGSSPNLQPKEGQVHILKLSSLANQFRLNNRRLPQDIDELKSWAHKLKPEELQKLGIDNLEDTFISPRDKQPYQINKPGNEPQAKMGMVAVLIYEKGGVKGKHMTASSMGSFAELTRDQLKAQVRDAGP
jgi:hypothetical protein